VVRIKPVHLVRLWVSRELDHYRRRRAHHLLLRHRRIVGSCGYGLLAGFDSDAVLPGARHYFAGEGRRSERTSTFTSSRNEDVALLRRIRLGVPDFVDHYGFFRLQHQRYGTAL